MKPSALNPQYMELVAELRVRRRARKITQAQLGAKLGVAQKTVQSWETGRRTPQVKTLFTWLELMQAELRIYPWSHSPSPSPSRDWSSL